MCLEWMEEKRASSASASCPKASRLGMTRHLLSAENGPSRPGAAGLGLVAREFLKPAHCKTHLFMTVPIDRLRARKNMIPLAHPYTAFKVQYVELLLTPYDCLECRPSLD